MHELSIAMSIVDIATKEAEKAGTDVVLEVDLDIGTMAGIEFESLEFALSVATQGTLLEKTAFNINRIQAKAKCLDCNREFDIRDILSGCPGCDSPNIFLTSGKELRISSLLIE
ncbi:MAG TPA: hydrogenase maturation nickel metallochaperone HypA [Bacteroidales bacterium]|nr:hydrogenase maturation nickel metallochaperone HypA [Bacteroidales bacterium]